MPAATFGVWCLTRPTSGGSQHLTHIQITAGVPAVDFSIALPQTSIPFQSMLRSWQLDRSKVYIGVRTPSVGVAELWRYDALTNTFTMIYSQGPGTNLTHITDIVFPGTLERVTFAVGTLNDYGESFHEANAEDTWQGLWEFPQGGSLNHLGFGHHNGWNSGNINHPNTIMGVCVAPTMGGWNYYTAHARCNSDTFGHTSTVSIVDSAGGPVDLVVPDADAFPFAYWTLFPIQWHGEWLTPGVWFIADLSGTGAYSFATSDTIYTAPAGFSSVTTVNTPILSGAIGGLFFDGSDKGFIFDTNGNQHVWQLTSRGASITEKIALSPNLFASRWCYDIHDTFPYGVIAYSSNTGADGGLAWTDDDGDSWHTWVSSGLQIDAITFGIAMPPPVPPGPWPETLTFRDARGFTGRVQFYTSAADSNTAMSQALAIAGDINGLTNSALNTALGAWTRSPVTPINGLNFDFAPIEERAVLNFVDASGAPIDVEVPAPFQAIFDASQEVIDMTNPGVISATNDMIANKLCNRGGMVAVNFLGGRRRKGSLRQKETVRTLNPSETGPAE